MLWTIVVILAVLWLLGMVSSYTMGGAVHLLLVLAVIVLLFNLLQGSKGLQLSRCRARGVPGFARRSSLLGSSLRWRRADR